jgi:hypothetical protein
MSGTQIDALPHECGSKKGLKVFAQEEDFSASLNGSNSWEDATNLWFFVVGELRS